MSECQQADGQNKQDTAVKNSEEGSREMKRGERERGMNLEISSDCVIKVPLPRI